MATGMLGARLSIRPVRLHVRSVGFVVLSSSIVVKWRACVGEFAGVWRTPKRIGKLLSAKAGGPISNIIGPQVVIPT